MATIAIRQRLHDGIYRSEGGGQTRTIWTREYTPRSFIYAAHMFQRLWQASVRSYGSIGAGRMWAVLIDDDSETDITELFEVYRHEHAKIGPATAVEAKNESIALLTYELPPWRS